MDRHTPSRDTEAACGALITTGLTHSPFALNDKTGLALSPFVPDDDVQSGAAAVDRSTQLAADSFVQHNIVNMTDLSKPSAAVAVDKPKQLTADSLNFTSRLHGVLISPLICIHAVQYCRYDGLRKPFTWQASRTLNLVGSRDSTVRLLQASSQG